MKINKLPKVCDRRDEGLVNENVGLNIKLARKSVGLSQIELARLIGFKSATAITLIESGKRKITIGKLWCVAQITDEPINNFFLKGLIS